MFNSTVRKCSETHACIGVASGLLPIVLALVAAQLAYPQSQPIATILQGQLLTTKRVPVANATVQWSLVGAPNPSQTGVSDSAGNFAFEFPLSTPTQVQLATNANLYTPTQTTVQLQPGTTTQVQVTLTRRPAGQYGAVLGAVRNANGLVIPNATVSILGAGDFLRTNTDANGKFKFTLIGFNSNLTLQASTANAPCIAATQVPFALSSTYTVVSVKAPRVLSITANCPPPSTPPPPTPPGGPAAHAVNPLANDPTVLWQQADSLSIQNNDAPNAWNAGHVNDIVRLPPGQGLLVASDEGGVWTIAEDSSRTAVPLSNMWTSISVSALALGTGGPADVYAGTFQYGDSEGGDLWETDTSQSLPLMNWQQVSPKPPCGSIYRMLVVAESDSILLACDSGLWWSQIPAPPSAKGIYNWAQAAPAAIGSQAFSGLAKGPGWSFGGPTGTIVASRFGGSAPNNIIYTAKWRAGKLVLTGSTVSIATTQLSRTSVAACASNPQIMYAAASDSDGQAMGGVFQSSNGGVNWSPVILPPSPGSFGDSNQAVAVSPDCGTVALGWEAGTFVSFTGGGSWNLLTDSGNYNNLHIGIHALTFDPVLPATLFIGSDGGVASAAGLTNGSTPTFESDWNRELFNLEFLVGAASASSNGLVAGASQDNGVLYAGLPGPWQHVNDCGGLCPKDPGELALFATPISIGPGNDLLVDATVTAPIGSEGQYVESMGGVIPFNAQTGIPVIPTCSLCVIILAAPVRFPGGFVNGLGQKMIAVGNIGPSDWTYGGVYGLFANDDGGGVHWELLNGGGMYGRDTVTAIAPTYDGSSIFLSSSGELYRLDAPFTGPAVDLATEYCCEVNAIYAFNKNLAFAISGFNGTISGASFMSWNGTSLNLAGEATLPHDRPFLSIAALDTRRMYIASSAGVFDTSDGGNTWSTASTGLPTLIQEEGPNDVNIVPTTHDYLQLVTEPSGDTRLYLASYGRSLWRTSYPLPPPPAQRSMTSVTITIQTGNDNAADYTELQAKIAGAVSICLKPSSTTDASPGGVCPNGSGAPEWANGAIVTQTFSLSPSLVLDNSTIEIDLFEHNSGTNGPDNWDIQGITVTGSDWQGPLNLLQISVPLNGDNCMARLKGSPNPSSVTYALSSNDPSGVNQTHPVPNFGPTPPGSCPQ
jgi:hypothetical protein